MGKGFNIKILPDYYFMFEKIVPKRKKIKKSNFDRNALLHPKLHQNAFLIKIMHFEKIKSSGIPDYHVLILKNMCIMQNIKNL